MKELISKFKINKLSLPYKITISKTEIYNEMIRGNEFNSFLQKQT